MLLKSVTETAESSRKSPRKGETGGAGQRGRMNVFSLEEARFQDVKVNVANPRINMKKHR